MTFYSISLMWAIVLFGVLLWTTACVVLNAALRRGMGIMGLILSYAVLVWMIIDLPLKEALVTWSIFAVLGGALTFVYEVWARRKYVGTDRKARRLVRVEGIVLWPSMVPDAVGLMLNDAGIIPADDRSEAHGDDARRMSTESPKPDPSARRGSFYDLR